MKITQTSTYIFLMTIIAAADGNKLRRKLVDTITFDAPSYHGKRLAYCLKFESGCGKPAADAYCEEKGFGEAADFPKRRSYRKETLTLEQLSTCSPAHNVCDTFDYITCRVKEQTYYDPVEHDRALDGCYKFATSCGEKAADAYCKDKGYNVAKDYSRVDAEGETMSIGDHSVCDPSWHKCSTFTYIICVASSSDASSE